jgi:hypothetical protein
VLSPKRVSLVFDSKIDDSETKDFARKSMTLLESTR